jgi:signal transduction histidine kinase
MALALGWLVRLVVLPAAHVFAWWRTLRLPCKFAAGASMLVAGGMTHLGLVATGHVRESAVQRGGAQVALYMDSFVERYVQELATRAVLSTESQEALERLLSPASMHRPIVAFRIWRGDTIVFSNERVLVGKTIARTSSRERAWQGQVSAELEEPRGDEHEQIRSLTVPILEVYAPVRERGTGRIIALVESYEIAINLRNEVWFKQLEAWVVIVGIAMAVVLLLFSMATTAGIERKFLFSRIAELSRLRAVSEMRHQRATRARLHVSEMSERSLLRIGDELHAGPTQFLALVLLKFEALDQLASRASAAMPSSTDEHREDLETIRKALNDALCHIRRVASNLLPADFEKLSVAETFARAARCHERQTGMAVIVDTRALPEQLPFPIKACLYRFALESLDSTSNHSGVQSISAWCDDTKVIVEIVGGQGTLNAGSQSLSTSSRELESLCDRIESVGGKVNVTSTPTGGVSLIAELGPADTERAGD